LIVIRHFRRNVFLSKDSKRAISSLHCLGCNLYPLLITYLRVRFKLSTKCGRTQELESVDSHSTFPYIALGET
jgi:hypothetical protein